MLILAGQQGFKINPIFRKGNYSAVTLPIFNIILLNITFTCPRLIISYKHNK